MPRRMRIPTRMDTTITIMSDTAKLLRLQTLMSPTFPVGAFSYSHGLEQAIADGVVHDRAAVEDWLVALLRHGSGWNDAVIFAQSLAAYRDEGTLGELAVLLLVLSGSAERQMETEALGRAFADGAAQMGLDVSGLPERVPYAVAAGAICGREGIAAEAVLAVFLQAFSANLVAVAQRLVPLGQADALKILAALVPVHEAVAKRAIAASLDDLGGAAFASDIAAMRHESLQPRIFRT